MKRFVAVTIAGTAIAVLLGPRGPFGGFWAPAPTAPHLHDGLLAGFVVENMVENIAFGVGVAILVLGRKWFAARLADPARTTAAWLATGWLFCSWMPHAALHLHIGTQPRSLLGVEFVFHVGAIAAVATLMWALSSVRTAELSTSTYASTSGWPPS